jgi:alpha-D-ribose 1-methylphosphonate 5-triphosphate synthase subunit PhnL
VWVSGWVVVVACVCMCVCVGVMVLGYACQRLRVVSRVVVIRVVQALLLPRRAELP